MGKLPALVKATATESKLTSYVTGHGIFGEVDPPKRMMES